MNRLTALFIALIAGFFCLSGVVAAQSANMPPFSQPIGFQIRSTSHVDQDIAARTKVAAIDGASRPALYFLTGAAIGAVVMGVAAGIEMSKCADDCMLAGPMFMIAVGTGAAGGGILGLLTYAWTRTPSAAPETK